MPRLKQFPHISKASSYPLWLCKYNIFVELWTHARMFPWCILIMYHHAIHV